ncbi:MAG: BlaI/MecI/CopY family transcriptional regulator [Planctomycetes bacterium]|nr:BlaI/MecI/CopY family transcriptional regulator [Planctomycetota bacterium]
MSRQPQPDRDVTGAELAVLEALWELGQTTVRVLADRLYPGGAAAHYATVQKLLQRLGEKGCVERVPDTAPIGFRALVDRDALVARRLARVVDELCHGSITPLLSHLAARELSASERDELRAFLDRLQQSAVRPRRRRER